MFSKTLLRMLALVGATLLVWSVLARPSGAHAPRAVMRVQAGETLWSIAASHYGGDPGGAVWSIEQANHLTGAAIYPGETLVLP
jgi:LysM repeat protein